MQPSISFFRKIVLLTSFLALASPLFSQADTALITIKLGRKITSDPELLVAALTVGKSNEQEKFDAIFSWVATNIKYDYRQYFSGEGSSAKTDIKRVLRRKLAICGEYADLMNHLCNLAGIHSITITGYTKDRLFDIHDSLFFDNHAWNAVELNGRWYLYDVTWSAGGYTYRLTWFSQLVFNCQQYILENKVRDLKRRMVIRLPKNSICETSKRKEVKRYTTRGLPLLWNITHRILSMLPQRSVVDHGEILNRQFYLTEPGLFATTHFPNIPYWSLTSDISDISEFSNDSSYYYSTPEHYLIQDRDGTVCLKCDEFFTRSPIEQQQENIRYSLENNPRNGVASSGYAFTLADLYAIEAGKATDSTEKAYYYDSTFQTLDFVKKELGRSRKELTAYHKFHFAKEKSKVKQLRRTNKKHTETNIEQVEQTRSRAKKVSFLQHKLASGERSCLRYANTYQKVRARTPAGKPLKDKSVDVLQKRVDKHEAKIDSLNVLLDELKPQFHDEINQLTNKVLQQNQVLYPLTMFFYKTAYTRIVYSQDDRDKPINDIQDSIFLLEQTLSATVRDELLLPTDSLIANFLQLMKMIKLRDVEQLKLLKVYAQLYTGQALSLDEFNSHRKRFIDASNEIFCYFFKLRPPLYFYLRAFGIFRDHHYALYDAIKTDNRAEARRYRSFLNEVLRNKRRVRHVIDHNMKAESSQKRKLAKERKAWLKQLRTNAKARRK